MGSFHYSGYSSDEQFLKYLDYKMERNKIPADWPCFGGIHEAFQYEFLNPYITQICNSQFFHHFVNEFNSKFRHIRIRIVKEYKICGSDDGYGVYVFQEKNKEDFILRYNLKELEYSSLFGYTVEFDPGYNKCVQLCFIPIIGELIRMGNNLEYQRLYEHTTSLLNPDENLIPQLIRISNKIGKSIPGNPFYVPVKEENFYSFDDIYRMAIYFKPDATIPDIEKSGYVMHNTRIKLTRFYPPTQIMLYLETSTVEE